MDKNSCKICKKTIYGRPEKVFCSVKCKSYYHYKLRKATNLEAEKIDTILHRNRSILLEILGKRKMQIKVPRILLEQKKFRFKYLTHFHVNQKGKRYHFVYDIAWMEFSDDAILIVKR